MLGDNQTVAYLSNKNITKLVIICIKIIKLYLVKQKNICIEFQYQKCMLSALYASFWRFLKKDIKFSEKNLYKMLSKNVELV